MGQSPSSLITFGPKVLVVGTLIAASLVITGCGKREDRGASGQAMASSMEPIDAVPLPLDDPIPVSTPKSEPAPTPAENIEVEPVDTEILPDTTDESGTVSAVPTSRVAVARRESAASPAQTAASPRPAVPTPPPAEPEKPVLNF